MTHARCSNRHAESHHRGGGHGPSGCHPALRHLGLRTILDGHARCCICMGAGDRQSSTLTAGPHSTAQPHQPGLRTQPPRIQWGNPWVTMGTWTPPAGINGKATLTALTTAHLWMGLKSRRGCRRQSRCVWSSAGQRAGPEFRPDALRGVP